LEEQEEENKGHSQVVENLGGDEEGREEEAVHVPGRDGGGGPAVRGHVHVGVRDDVALGVQRGVEVYALQVLGHADARRRRALRRLERPHPSPSPSPCAPVRHRVVPRHEPLHGARHHDQFLRRRRGRGRGRGRRRGVIDAAI